MRKLCILWMLVSITASCQDFGKLELVADLPGLLKEVSGVEKFPDDPLIWMINDSRNPPEIYGFDTISQKVQKVLRLKNASNIDWEDLATDTIGNLYVGDFGNNISNRTDLTIYRVPEPGSSDRRRTEPQITTFRYADQEEFPPKKKDLSFDVEAFIHLDGHFYLFTRNRAKKYDGTTKIYKVPAQDGEFEAVRIGSFKTGEDQSDCEVTAATIHHPTGTIALLSYNKVWLFKDYEGDDFTSGTLTEIKLKHKSQKESICFISENELLIADERSHGKGGNLYVLRLDE
ncbi:MAG: hypothetical protein AAF466_07500 [Bacteroidota bacterium]